MKTEHKVVIIGCGMVGSTIAYTLMNSELYDQIVLIDSDMSRAEGEALDISHGIPFHRPMQIYAGSYEDASDAELIIIAAGGNQSASETRLDLTNRNVDIIRQIIPLIMCHNYSGRLLIVSNPVDILTYVAWKLSGLPREHVIGSGTVLDSARLKYLIGRHIDVDSRSVHAYVIGEHGDSEIAAWSSATISGVPLRLFCSFSGKNDDTEQKVRNLAYEIIKKKHATYYGIGAAVNRICEAISRDEQSVLPVSGVLEGEYDINGVAISVPRIVGAEGIEGYVPLQLNIDEYDALLESASMLKKILHKLGFQQKASNKKHFLA